jgi:hypothetical protein
VTAWRFLLIGLRAIVSKSSSGYPLFVDLAKIIASSNVWDGATSPVPLEKYITVATNIKTHDRF